MPPLKLYANVTRDDSTVVDHFTIDPDVKGSNLNFSSLTR